MQMWDNLEDFRKYRLGSQGDEAGIKAGEVQQAYNHQGFPVCGCESANKCLCLLHKGQLLSLSCLGLSCSCITDQANKAETLRDMKAGSRAQPLQ